MIFIFLFEPLYLMIQKALVVVVRRILCCVTKKYYKYYNISRDTKRRKSSTLAPAPPTLDTLEAPVSPPCVNTVSVTGPDGPVNIKHRADKY